jgi:hypothetical protein
MWNSSTQWMFATNTHFLTMPPTSNLSSISWLNGSSGKGWRLSQLYSTAAPERVISERAQAVNAHYIMFGLHQNGHSSSYSRKSLVAKVIKHAPCAIFTFAQSAGRTKFVDYLCRTAAST